MRPTVRDRCAENGLRRRGSRSLRSVQARWRGTPSTCVGTDRRSEGRAGAEVAAELAQARRRAPRPARRTRRRCGRARARTSRSRRAARCSRRRPSPRVAHRGDERSGDRHRRRGQPAQLFERRHRGTEVAQRHADARARRARPRRATRPRDRARRRPRARRASTATGVTSLRTSMSRTSSGSTGDSAPVRVSVMLRPGTNRAGRPPLPVGDVREHGAHERDVERARHPGLVDDPRDRLGVFAHTRRLPVDRAVEARRRCGRRGARAASTAIGRRGWSSRRPTLRRDASRLRELAAQLVVEHLDPTAAHALGAVRGDVGVREQLVDRDGILARRARDADARADQHLVAVHVVRLVQRVEQTLRELQRVLVRGAGAASASSGSRQHTTNSSPPSRTQRSPPRNVVAQPLRDLDEQLVARRVARACRSRA